MYGTKNIYMKKLQVIAGNCVLESLKTSLDTSSFLNEMSQKFNFDLVYKSSYKKDNRFYRLF